MSWLGSIKGPATLSSFGSPCVQLNMKPCCCKGGAIYAAVVDIVGGGRFGVGPEAKIQRGGCALGEKVPRPAHPVGVIVKRQIGAVGGREKIFPRKAASPQAGKKPVGGLPLAVIGARAA